MAEFGVESYAEVIVDERSLREARDDIEDGLGDISVSVTGEAGGAAGMAMADGGGAGRSLTQLQRDRNELLTDIVELLEDGGGGGSVAGGGGGTTILGGLGVSKAGAAGAAKTGGLLGLLGTGSFLGTRAANDAVGTVSNEDASQLTRMGVPSFATYGTSLATGLAGESADFLRNQSDRGPVSQRDDPVVGGTPQWAKDLTSGNLSAPSWLSEFTSPSWIDQQPAWAQDLLTSAPNRMEEAPPGYEPNEYRGGYNLGGGDNGRPGGGSGPQARGPPSLESVQTQGVERSLDSLNRSLQSELDSLAQKIKSIERQITAPGGR